MKVLLDECLPRRLADHLAEFEVMTVPQAGWAGKRNGELLMLAAAKFDVFVTGIRISNINRSSFRNRSPSSCLWRRTIGSTR